MMILSLKNIYRLLTGQDFPLYSSAVIPSKNRRGLTLVGFWQENLLYEFRTGKSGKLIWRNTGGRNRYISDVCNRSERLHFYGEYAEELAQAVTPEVLLRQVEQFMLFLRERNYSEKAFERRLGAFLEQAAKEDPYFPKGLAEFLLEPVGAAAPEMALFQRAWQISILMLFALSGSEMNGAVMMSGILRNELRLGVLWGLYTSKSEGEGVRYLTGMNSELCSEPLAPHHFFGREEELFGLRDCLASGGCYLISGMGGVGKTELARQFLKLCEKERLVDVIAVVQYDGSLMESLMRAFHMPPAGDADDNINNCLSRIRAWEGSRVLVMVDNMNHTLDEDPNLERLKSLPGTVFVTSRLAELPGFRVYPVHPPQKNTAKLIFRDNYDHAFSTEDHSSMERILDHAQLCHPLIMKLLGQGASANGWSVQDLDTRMEMDASGFTRGAESKEIQLRRIYQKMYSLWNIDREREQLLRLFSLFPYESYELPFLTHVLGGYFLGGRSVGECLDSLYQLGWLEKRGGRYGMHPFIAECVQPDAVSEEELTPLYEAVFQTKIPDEKYYESGNRLFESEKDRPYMGASGKAFSEEHSSETRMSGSALSGDRTAETRMLHSASADDYTEEIYIDETGPDVDVRQASLARLVVHAAGHVTGAVSLTFMRRTLSAMTCMQRQWGVSSQAEQAITGLLGRCEEAGDREQVLFISAKLVLSAQDQEVLREIYDRQEGGRNLSPEDQYLLCLALGNAYASQGKKEAAPILERAMELAATDEQKMSVCHVCAQYYTLIGDLRQEIRWCEDGYAIFLASGERQPVIAFQLTTLLCGIYITQHRTEEAKEILSRMEKTIRTLDLPCLQIPYQAVKGQLAIVTGNPAGGAEIFKEVLKMTFVYNGVKDGLYYSFLQELGTAYRLDRKHAEAEVCYQDCVEFWKQAGNPFQVLALQNNIGALYQNWGKLAEAAETLEQAYHTAERIKNDRQRGIIAGNLSKVCRELGESEKEYFYLKEASPLLDQIYGPQDATSMEARRRLQEIEAQGEV